MNPLPVRVADLMPHAPPLLMIDRIIDCDHSAKKSTVTMHVSADSPFVGINNELDPEAFLEIIAQAAAAQHGYNIKRDGGKEEKGFLVGTRNFMIHGKAFAEDKLTVQVECTTEIESLSAVSGTVSKNNQMLASAVITVWHGEK